MEIAIARGTCHFGIKFGGPNFRTLSVDPQLIGIELMLILVFGHYKWTAGLLILRSGSFADSSDFSRVEPIPKGPNSPFRHIEEL